MPRVRPPASFPRRAPFGPKFREAKLIASTRAPRNCRHRRESILQDDTDPRRFLELLAEPGAKTDSKHRDAGGRRANPLTGARGVKRKSRWRDDDEMKQRCHGVG